MASDDTLTLARKMVLLAVHDVSSRAAKTFTDEEIRKSVKFSVKAGSVMVFSGMIEGCNLNANFELVRNGTVIGKLLSRDEQPWQGTYPTYEALLQAAQVA